MLRLLKTPAVKFVNEFLLRSLHTEQEKRKTLAFIKYFSRHAIHCSHLITLYHLQKSKRQM